MSLRDRTRARTTRAVGFWLVAYAFTVNMLGTTVPTPLYPIYQERFGFSGELITVIFAVYAFGVIAGLLLFGQLSDEVGRRRLMLPGLVLSALSAVAFVVTPGLPLIFVGRVLSGLSAGIFTGTATAALVDLAPEDRRGLATGVAVAVNLGGLGLGALLAGLLAQLAPAPLRLAYWVDLGLVVLAIMAVLAVPETVDRGQSARWRLQRLGIPPEIRGVFIRAATAGACAFAVSGLFSAVAPGLLADLIGLKSHALAGFLVFLVFLASAAGQLAVRRMAAPMGLPAGCVALVVGVGLVAAAIEQASLALLLASAVIVGLGQGVAVGSGLAAINTGAPPERRGEAASSFFVLLYVGLSVPVIGVGVADQAFGLRDAGVAFSAIIGVLVLVVLASLAGRPTRR
jgi:MFS family permease